MVFFFNISVQDSFSHAESNNVFSFRGGATFYIWDRSLNFPMNRLEHERSIKLRQDERQLLVLVSNYGNAWTEIGEVAGVVASCWSS